MPLVLGFAPEVVPVFVVASVGFAPFGAFRFACVAWDVASCAQNVPADTFDLCNIPLGDAPA